MTKDMNMQAASAQTADSGWPAEVLSGPNMPFRPTDALVTTQNPPDFSWPYVSASDSYHLQVSRDAEMKGVIYENGAIPTNFYNFPAAFEAGTWYWQVRFHEPAAGWSNWSRARRFRIAEENVPFPVPPIEELMSRTEKSHPRIWTHSGELAAFRALRLSGNGKHVFEKAYASAVANLNRPLPEDPSFPYMEGSISTVSPEYVKALQDLRAYADPALGRMLDSAFVYLITGDAKIGANAKDQLLNFASWDPDAATRFEINDQVHRAVAYRCAIAYDWLYDLLTPDDRRQVQDMIKIRTATLIDKYLVGQPIYQYPYDSHGWTIIGYIGLMAVALLGDIPEAEDWMRRSVPAFINILPPWGGEDGSWSQGTGYWQWSSASNKELMDVLLSAGVINLYDKAFSRHEGMYPLYMFPHGSPTGVFGNDSHYKPDWPSISLLNRLAQMYQDPRLKWTSEAIGSTPSSGLQDYFYGDANLASKPPSDLPKGRWFPTTGLAAMHSELEDAERISLYFRSSPYGSYSHSQADQNGFILHAYGEPLAIKSGVYDYYNSVHHRGFTKQTFSANTITYDGRQGQPIDDFDADGRILGFVSHPDFDAVSGDASSAYRERLTKALRHILYVRPYTYVVIDDLATAKTEGAEFEWNLHAEEELSFDTDGAGATIHKGKAGLRVRFYGPQVQSYRTTYETAFRNADGAEVPPGGIFSGTQHIHAAFITPATKAAKMVATLQPYKRGEACPSVTSADVNGYTKLIFAEGVTVYIRQADSGIVDTGSIQFDGSAAAVKGESILLVNGTELRKNGIVLAESDVPSTIAYGHDILSVSVQADARISLYAPGVIRVRDGDSCIDLTSGGAVAERMNVHGVHWTTVDDRLTIHMEKGLRTFRLSDVPAAE